MRDQAKPTQSGSIEIAQPSLEELTPLPDSWIMLKPGDLVVSRSGTIRLLLRKIWQSSEAEFLRLKCENQQGKVGASLDIEKLDINESNFENLSFVMRDTRLPDKNRVTLSAQHFSKIVRFNILTLLGFGSVGSKLHILVPALGTKTQEDSLKVRLKADLASGQMYDLVKIDKSPPRKQNEEGPLKTLDLDLFWVKDAQYRIYRILSFVYPSGASAVTLESITLASEIANLFSVASACLTKKNKEEKVD